MPNVFAYFLIIFFILINYPSFAEKTEDKIKYVVGNPYKIKGKWYYPKNNLDYHEVGIASVNVIPIPLRTKNGEFFSYAKVFAKHKTLALPTIVRVTNLYNGYSINVRINDRGPKNNLRIIELSKKTASYLKIKNKGLVEIKVISDLTMLEQTKLKGENLTKNSKENLEQDIALGKEVVETEDLMNKKKIKKKKKKKKKNNKEKKNIVFPYSNKQKDFKLNYKKSRIPPYYLRIEITNFKTFESALNLKKEMKPIYDKILITLSLLNGEKYYKVTTVPIKTLNETEQILTVIHKKGFNNAKLFIERKKR